MEPTIQIDLPEDSHSEGDVASGVPEETARFAQLASEIMNFAYETEVWSIVRFAGKVDLEGGKDVERLVGAMLRDDLDYPDNPELVQEFESLYEEFVDIVATRTAVLENQTSLTEREAQVYLMSSVPTSENGELGLQRGMISLVISKLAGKESLITTGAIGQYESRAEEKIYTGMKTRYLCQYLGHPPEGYPEERDNYTPESTVPLRSTTRSRLVTRLRRSSRGTTVDDIISELLDETRNIIPLREFVRRYMEAQPAAGMVILTNSDSDSTLRIQGVINGEDGMHTPSTTEPLRLIHQSQNPYQPVRPEVVRETDAIRVGGVEKQIDWNETIGYSSSYMKWIYTDLDQSWEEDNRPNLSLDDCERIVSEYIS